MGEELDAGNLLDDADVEAAQKDAEADVTPAEPEPTPAAPEPEAAPEPGEFDRSANFRDTLQGILEHVPEDKRKAVESRIEQAERWASEANEAKELKARFGDLNALAKELQDKHKFEHGAEFLKDKGAVAYVKEALNYLQGPGKADETPAEELVDDGLDPNAKRLDAIEQRLEAEAQARRDEAEQARLAKQFAADFDPRVAESVKKMNVSEEKVGEVGEAFADFAQNLYMQRVLNSDNPESVTVASAVAQAAKAIDIIVEARTAKRSAPPRPKVQEAVKVNPEGEDFSDQMDALSDELFGAVDESFRKG